MTERWSLSGTRGRKGGWKRREWGQWEGGETEDPALWDSSCVFWGVDRVALNAEHHWTPTGGLLSVGLCVCVCSETRPTSDPCTTHTLLYLLPSSSSDLNPPIVRMRVLESWPMEVRSVRLWCVTCWIKLSRGSAAAAAMDWSQEAWS